MPTRRGAPRNKGARLGSPKTPAQTAQGGGSRPSEAGAALHAWDGLWHAVLPGRLVRGVVRRRQGLSTPKQSGPRKPPPAIAAFFTPDLTWSADEIGREYRHRWAVELPIRDSNACAGLGQDQCRKRQRLVGAHTLRLVLAAARTLWCRAHVDRGRGVPRCRSRPWYRQQVAPSQLDVAEAWREALYEAGMFPLPRFSPDLTESHKEPEQALPLAA